MDKTDKTINNKTQAQQNKAKTAVLIKFPNNSYKPSFLKRQRILPKERQRLLRRHGLDGHRGARIQDFELILLEKSVKSDHYKNYRSQLEAKTSTPLADNIVLLDVQRVRRAK
jgi:hypothetical protein